MLSVKVRMRGLRLYRPEGGSLSALFRHVSLGALLLIILVSHGLWFVSASAQAITRGYTTDDPDLRPGMTVSLTGDKSGGLPKVGGATISDQDRIIGVATTLSDSLVTVGSSGAQVYIENEGNVAAFVADVNGTIKRGDLLSISPLKGLLMKSTGTSRIIAIAQEDFSAEKAVSYKITGAAKSSVLVEEIQVNLDTKGGSQQQDSQSTALAKIGRSLTGRQISDLRMMVALVVFFIVMISEGAILYGAISSALRSLGRNPMASTVIRREMIRVVLVALVVLLVGLAAIYAMVWA